MSTFGHRQRGIRANRRVASASSGRSLYLHRYLLFHVAVECDQVVCALATQSTVTALVGVDNCVVCSRSIGYNLAKYYLNSFSYEMLEL